MTDNLEEWNLHIDIFNAAIPLREDNPGSWPCVRIAHLPTGIIEYDQSTPSQRQNKEAALARIAERVRAKAPKST